MSHPDRGKTKVEVRVAESLISFANYNQSLVEIGPGQLRYRGITGFTGLVKAVNLVDLCRKVRHLACVATVRGYLALGGCMTCLMAR